MKGTFNDAKHILSVLVDRGHSAFLAGGCVRDLLLGLEPNDYDVTTSATPEEVQALFQRTVPVGISFGVVKVVIDNREIDVATFRTDGTYSDNRRPDSVAYSKSAEEDVKRRDFTINALLMDIDGNVIDHVGGQKDLNSRVLRAVGNAGDRFQEDSLRMLRAIRFAIRFRMDIDHEAWLNIRAMKANIKNVSKERVTDELSKMFCHGAADRAYLLLRRSGLWAAWFDIVGDADDSWRILWALAELRPEDPFVLALAIITAEMYPSEREGVLDCLTLTNNQRKSYTSLFSHEKDLRRFLLKSLSEQRKMMQWEDLDLVLRFLECQKPGGRFSIDYPSDAPLLESYFFAKMAEIKALGWPGPLVNGDDLIEMGFIAGPIFTKMLDLVREEQLEGRLDKMEDVKPFLINRFPATARKLEDGKVFDDTHPRRVAAPCPTCGLAMVVTVAKSPEGAYLWDDVKDKINVRISTTSLSFISNCCYARKRKRAFTEVKI